MAGNTSSWVHGNAVVMEVPATEDDGVFAFTHFGWGTQITMRPGFSRWFHIPLPTPVILDGQRLKLTRVFLGFRQSAGLAGAGSLQDAVLYDGETRVAGRSSHDFKTTPGVTITNFMTFELIEPRSWGFGAGLSFQLSGLPSVGGHLVDNTQAPVIIIGSAGADYSI